MSHWEEADAKYGQTVVCATISPHGMGAYHTSAAVQTPDGDYNAIAGQTFKQGPVATEPGDGQVLVRPGYEPQVAQQKRQFRARQPVRPTQVQAGAANQIPTDGPEPDTGVFDPLV